MTTREKIKIILDISKLTQQELAVKLNISFQTINSWINKRSVPRQKKIDKINELYLELTGQQIIPSDVLDAKKLIIIDKCKKDKLKILNIILSRQDIYDDLVLNVTYHTNNIEGSTLTKGETQDILFNHNVSVDKSTKEILEAKNHQAAFDFLINFLSKNKKINENLILKLHSILMNGILPNAGAYRGHAVRIVGSNIPTANYLSIQKLMDKLFLDINKDSKDIISSVSRIHAEFERIHPFSDGNGRVGRLLLIGQLMSHNLPPAIITKEFKQKYYTYLAKAQSSDDSSLMEDFICFAIMEGFVILNIK